MKKIGIDARFLGPQGTGLGRYVEKLLENLQELDKENTYRVFLRNENFDVFKPKNPNFEKVRADARWYSLKEQILLPQLLEKESLDLLHVPHFNIPVFYKGKMIVTIHDLIKSEFTGVSSTTRSPFVYWFKHLTYEAVIRLAVKRAKKVLVPSNFIKERLVSRLKVPESKILVTLEGAPDEDSFKKTIIKTPVVKPYFLYVGNSYPYKNLNRLLKALKFVKNVSLVVVSSRDEFSERLEKSISNLGLKDRVIITGFVPDEELMNLYRGALALVFPSLSEGFGLPILEAMSNETAVVCSDIGVLREVGGNAALYFNPLDETDIADKLEKVLLDKEFRQGLIKAGKKRVKEFSWRKMAEQTLKVYEEVLT